MQRKMEVNESNFKYAFPFILRSIPNFLRENLDF